MPEIVWEQVRQVTPHAIWAKLVTGDMPEGWHVWDPDLTNDKGDAWCTRCQNYHALPPSIAVDYKNILTEIERKIVYIMSSDHPGDNLLHLLDYVRKAQKL